MVVYLRGALRGVGYSPTGAAPREAGFSPTCAVQQCSAVQCGVRRAGPFTQTRECVLTAHTPGGALRLCAQAEAAVRRADDRRRAKRQQQIEARPVPWVRPGRAGLWQ